MSQETITCVCGARIYPNRLQLYNSSKHEAEALDVDFPASLIQLEHHDFFQQAVVRGDDGKLELPVFCQKNVDCILKTM